ncbi:MAG: diguanylate cyclase [Candidatus Omnitrophota bacterium]
MSNFIEQVSLVPRPLRYKLMVAFALMSVIPLLVCVYLVINFVFPKYETMMGSVSALILVTVFLTLSGLRLAKEMIMPIVRMSQDAKKIANGDYQYSVNVVGEDEISDLAKSLNTMSQAIKDNIAELKRYGERTKDINIDINKKILALSGLLQIGSLISSGTELKNIIEILVAKIADIENGSPTAIMRLNDETDMLEPISFLNFKSDNAINQAVTLGRSLLGRVAVETREIIIDSNTLEIAPDTKMLLKNYNINNLVAIPLIINNRCKGILLTGNSKPSYVYTDDDIELLKVFAKQAVIAISNDSLNRRAAELEIVDELTGLYNQTYFMERFDEEIKRAIMYQRPCSFIILKINQFDAYCEKNSRMAGEAALRKIGKLVIENITAVDKAARIADDEFVIMLPERNKREASVISKEITRKISELVIDKSAQEEPHNLTASCGISENPLDGATREELVTKARNRLDESMKVQK